MSIQVDVNINEQCTVTLTEYGADIFRKYHEGLKQPVKVAARDQKHMPLWECMQIFGPCLYNGNPMVPFVGNIVVLGKSEWKRDHS